MTPVERYAVTIPGAPGGHAPPRVVVVHHLRTTGPDGRPVYADESGTLVVYVSGGVAEPVGAPSGMTAHPCLQAHPVP
ncbi:DUF6296 family protein [Kitasatospora sp. NPDC049285]|uniref:DUF6296 family protein n=1 Tax=Kitasatospora sp. NPDC049285 TaxID=3157096 RepID=UPI0034290968